ncbi:MAG: hypothetical protein RIC89_16115 [Pseudomonadales bacterium]
MAELLGVGITHYPPLLGEPDSYANLLRLVLNSPHIPEEMKRPESWPAGMLDEWNNEHDAALQHQQRHREAFRAIRQTIDDFEPDAVIIFGDDQYENFKEDVIPPFNVYCMDAFPSKPFAMLDALGGGNNIWQVANTDSYDIPGAGRIARTLTHEIISRDCPVAYSYKYLNHPFLTHAFANAMVFLDWDRRGWNYPIIPIAVNCYGTGVVHTRGGMAQLFDTRADEDKDPYLDQPSPAGPTPRSCFTVGAALREALEAQDGRYVVMASSGWSHAFLTAKHHWLYPDREFDLARVNELKQGQQRTWAELSNDAIEDAGCQEFKNWICLAGAFPERQATILDYLDTWIFNSQKCFALLPA